MKKIKLVEAFAGYGSQRMALRNIGMEMSEDSAIIEWTIDAIIAYASVHHTEEFKETIIKAKEIIKAKGKDYVATYMNTNFTLSTEKSKGWIMEDGTIIKSTPTKANKEWFAANNYNGLADFKEANGDAYYLPMFLENWKKLKEDELATIFAACAVSKNLGSIMEAKGDDKRLIDVDIFTYSFPCFTGDTLVNTQNGMVPIKDIKIGDEVTTHNNNIKKVIDWAETGEKEIWEVKSMLSHNIRTTHNHEFWVRERYKEYVDGKQVRKFAKPEWKSVDSLTKDFYIGHPINQLSTTTDLTDNDLWLLGRYVADGHKYGKYGIVISANDDKLDEVITHIDYKYSVYKERTANKVYIHSNVLYEHALKIGTHSYNKEIPKYILNLSKEKLEIFFDGYWAGDGSNLRNEGLYSATTVSEKLAYSLGEAIAKIYNVPYRIYFNETPDTHVIEGRVVNQRDTYIVRFKKTTDKQDKAFVEDGFVWAPIRSITNTGIIETVYDITVEDDHSFTVFNTIVSNCQDLSLAGKMAGMTKKSRSGLLYQVERILKEQTLEQRPKVLLMENVKNLVGAKFMPDFQEWLKTLEELGYTTTWKVLNAKEHGVPQNRERVFAVSIKNGEQIDFNFDNITKKELDKKLKDFLSSEVEESYYISDEHIMRILGWTAFERPLTKILSNNSTDVGTITTRSGDDTSSQKLVMTQVDGNKNQLNIEDVLNGKHLILGINDTSQNYKSDNIVHGENYIVSTLRAGGTTQLVAIKITDYEKYENYWYIQKPEGQVDGNFNRVWKDDRYIGTLTTGGQEMIQEEFFILSDEDILTIAKHFGTEDMLELKEDGYYFKLSDGSARKLGYRKDAGNWLLPISRSHMNNIVGLDMMPTIMTDAKLIMESFIPLRIRKLIPREALRLMGVKDQDIDNIFEYITAKGPQYKLAGNSIVVNVLEEIFKELKWK